MKLSKRKINQNDDEDLSSSSSASSSSPPRSPLLKIKSDLEVEKFKRITRVCSKNLSTIKRFKSEEQAKEYVKKKGFVFSSVSSLKSYYRCTNFAFCGYCVMVDSGGFVQAPYNSEKIHNKHCVE